MKDSDTKESSTPREGSSRAPEEPSIGLSPIVKQTPDHKQTQLQKVDDEFEKKLRDEDQHQKRKKKKRVKGEKKVKRKHRRRKEKKPLEEGEIKQESTAKEAEFQQVTEKQADIKPEKSIVEPPKPIRPLPKTPASSIRHSPAAKLLRKCINFMQTASFTDYEEQMEVKSQKHALFSDSVDIKNKILCVEVIKSDVLKNDIIVVHPIVRISIIGIFLK